MMMWDKIKGKTSEKAIDGKMADRASKSASEGGRGGVGISGKRKEC